MRALITKAKKERKSKREGAREEIFLLLFLLSFVMVAAITHSNKKKSKRLTSAETTDEPRTRRETGKPYDWPPPFICFPSLPSSLAFFYCLLIPTAHETRIRRKDWKTI